MIVTGMGVMELPRKGIVLTEIIEVTVGQGSGRYRSAPDRVRILNP